MSPGEALNLNATDRRRLLLATAATVVALPAIWLFTRDEASKGSGAPSVAAAGVQSPEAQGGGPATTRVDPFGTSGPIFVDGPTTPPKPGIIQIVVPSDSDTGSIEGGATYQRIIGNAPDNCAAPNAPFAATLTVTNRDNGRYVTCVNRLPEVLPVGLEIKLTTAQFEQIGQLVDAPIPVRISWNGTE